MSERIYTPPSAALAKAKAIAAEVLPQPKHFPLHCLPPALANMGSAICENERVPESLVGCCLLGVLSASIGAGVQVRSGPDRITRANLFIMASGESGSGNSETLRHVLKPFKEFEEKLVEKWLQETEPRLMADKELLESEISQLKKVKAKDAAEREDIRGQLEAKRRELIQIEAKLHIPILSVEDITSQALAVSLLNHRECLASISSDAGEVINNLLGEYNKLDRTDDGLYVKAWSGDGFKQTRISRRQVILKRPWLSGLWLVQREKLEAILSSRSLTEGGAIPRILLCHTNCVPRPIPDIPPIGTPLEVSRAYERQLCELIEAFRFASEPITIDSTSETLRLFNEHYNNMVARWHAGELRDVTSYAVRWTEQAWRIAVCLHAGIHGVKTGEHKLSLETATAAVEMANWFSDQQLAILAAGREAVKEAKLTTILELLGTHPLGITARQVQRALHLASSEEAQFLLEELKSNGILDSTEKQTGGRPLRSYMKKAGVNQGQK